MPGPKIYATAGAFRRALEDRLKRIAQEEKVDVNRLRRQVAFDRLLARLFQPDQPPWVLKGGYALELLFHTARATIDIDLTLPGVDVTGGQPNDVIREMLQQAAGVSLDDWFEFTIAAPIMDLDAAPYGGARFPGRVARRRLASRGNAGADASVRLAAGLERLKSRQAVVTARAAVES